VESAQFDIGAAMGQVMRMAERKQRPRKREPPNKYLWLPKKLVPAAPPGPQPLLPSVRFDMGELTLSPLAAEKLGGAEIYRALRRHVVGDWGEILTADERADNEKAVAEKGGILSIYRSEENKLEFWIVTEGDRSKTTVSMAEEF